MKISETNATALEVKRDGNGKIYSHVRQKWLVETPEETVRQNFLLVLVNEYGYALDQIAEELDLTGRGSAGARADFVVWKSASDKNSQKLPLLIVECKSDNVTIKPEDYGQGDSYARIVLAPFVITHNSSETRFWRVVKDKMPGHLQEIGAVPKAGDSDKEIENITKQLKVFKEDQFARLLHKCHNIIRNREKIDPAAAFDEIAKILFVKVYVERQMRDKRDGRNLFTTQTLDQQFGSDPLQDLFNKTKSGLKSDALFGETDKVNLKPETGRAIVKELEAYNLSDTSEDIKGIAFERFLGRTFRGEIGQYFTPRPVVEFMIRFLNPSETDIVCDPASGSGGFLIRFFEIVREQILRDADAQYAAFKSATETDATLDEEEKAKRLLARYNAIQDQLKPLSQGSRLWTLANRRVYGTDANDRMARTSKMNMIMHGDGHGGVHHNDGLLNVNGIFENRFTLLLTNPPFGANVESDDNVPEVKIDFDTEQKYLAAYGEPYRAALQNLRNAQNKAISLLFDLTRGTKPKTEILFIERCLKLLQPGGRMGIVLPEGIFNNPSAAYVREWVEDRAKILAVVSLPAETFQSAKASVKTSLLFLQKFSLEEQNDYNDQLMKAQLETEATHAPRVEEERKRLEANIETAKMAKDNELRKTRIKGLGDFLKAEAARQKAEARALHKTRWSYPIFLYEAQHVGITATGEEDFDELLPPELSPVKRGLPPDVEKSCLELYADFQENPHSFFVTGNTL